MPNSSSFSIIVFTSLDCKSLFNHIDKAIKSKTANCATIFFVEATHISTQECV
ncbi:MAG: hypothetical protein LBC61_00800 [Candidatus Peribacteria bacterium]|nr:hypothetical protein [Candidatus Peribacteria bacterium]